MLQDQSRNRTPVPAAQPSGGDALPEPGGAPFEAGIARMLLAPAVGEIAQPDPVLAAVEAWRVRTAAMAAFDAQVAAGSFVGNKIAEEDRLIAQLSPARDAVLATVPTTPAGRAALVQFVRHELAASGMVDGEPPDDDHPIWRDGLRALLAAEGAEPHGRAAALHPRSAQGVPRPYASPALVAMVEEWQALLDRINGAGLSDADVEKLSERHGELQREICDFPSASTADLLAKVPVFRDELYDATHGLSDGCEAKDTLSGAAWLGLFRDFEHLAGTAAPPAAPSSARLEAADPHLAPVAAVDADAALIALVARFDAADHDREAADEILDAAYEASAASAPSRPAALRRAGDSRHFWGAASNPESPVFYEGDEVRRLRDITKTGHLHPQDRDAALARAAEIGAAWDEWLAACEANDVACGVIEAEARYEELQVACQAIRSEILAYRPSTLAGLAAKARAWKGTTEKAFAEAIWSDLMAMGEAEGCLRTGPALSDRIIACWREWATLPDFDETDQGRANLERLEAERFALCAEAEALPVSLGNVSTKALALAWLQYSDLWRSGDAREAYHIDGRLALDIDTAISGRLKTHYAEAAA